MSADPALTSMVLRAKIIGGQISGRTLVQSQVLDDDTHDFIELLLPPGYVANPLAGSDTIELQIAGFGSHKVQLGGDNTVDALTDLQPGESGLSRGGQQLIQRLTGTEIIASLLRWGPTREALVSLMTETAMAVYNTHTHPCPGGNTSPPTQQMTNADLTGGT